MIQKTRLDSLQFAAFVQMVVIIVGFLVMLLGLAIFLSNIVAFLLLPAFVCYMNRFQIAPEEKALAALFGQSFVAYKTRVRRWL